MMKLRASIIVSLGRWRGLGWARSECWFVLHLGPLAVVFAGRDLLDDITAVVKQQGREP